MTEEERSRGDRRIKWLVHKHWVMREEELEWHSKSIPCVKHNDSGTAGDVPLVWEPEGGGGWNAEV